MNEQDLKKLEDKLWAAADKMRGAVSVSDYKFVVLGLIFLKYISDSFEEKYKELVDIINENLTLDAFKREDARARIRVNIRRLLIKYNYPPIKREGAVAQVIKQAELKYANN